MTKRLRIAAVALSAFLAGGSLAGGGAYAHSPGDPDAVGNIPRLSEGANLVIQGAVTKVIYRTARSADSAVPYTFVTYSVAKVLQGSAPGPDITLRFIGGSDGRGGFLFVEGVPTFQPGDEDILFIANNGEASGCALVNCEFGRFRVFRNGVYEAHGSPVIGINGGRMAFGGGDGPIELDMFRYPTPPFDEVIKDPEVRAGIARLGLSLAEARVKYEAVKFVEIGTGGSAGPGDTRVASPPGLAVSSFVSSVRAALAAPTGVRSSLAAVRSANVVGALAVPKADAVALPPTPLGAFDELVPDPIIQKN